MRAGLTSHGALHRTHARTLRGQPEVHWNQETGQLEGYWLLTGSEKEVR